MTEAAEREALVDGALLETAHGHTPGGPRQKLKFGLLSLYGAGQLVEGATTPVLGLLLFYLGAICGLSGSEAGLIAGLTLVVDALCDPIVGSLSDNSRSRHGRRHPFMLLGLLPIVIPLGLLFSSPAALKGTALFGYALATLFVTRVGLSLFVVPYVGLGAELTDDYAERSTVVAYRVVFNTLIGLVMAILSAGVFLGGVHGQYFRPGYSYLAWTASAVALAAGLVSTLGTLSSRSRLHQPPPEQRTSLANFPAEVAEVLRNRSFRTVFFACFIIFAAGGAAGALGLYALSFFWKLFGSQLLPLGLVAAPAGIFGVFAAGVLARWMEKRTLTLLGLVLIVIAEAVPVFLRLGGVVGQDGVLPMLCAAVVLIAIGGSVSSIGFQSMMADAVDEHEHLFHARREGLFFAGIITSAKASSGVGAWIAGVALDLIGFPSGVAAGDPAAAHIAPETIRNLGLIYGPGAALCAVVAGVILAGHNLSRARHAQIRAELDARRAARGGG
jgi:GPH family glycoside/pentoside/hexuronide:cation symporter